MGVPALSGRFGVPCFMGHEHSLEVAKMHQRSSQSATASVGNRLSGASVTKGVAILPWTEQLYQQIQILAGELAMFPGVDAEKPCFGPAEIHVMRRALEL